MKYLAAFVLAFCSIFGFNQLVASELEEHLTYFWSGTEDDLYLNIKIDDELEFADDYGVWTTDNGQGQGCEVICKPTSSGSTFSSNGHELQKIEFTVILNNTNNPNKVISTTAIKKFYKGTDENGLGLITTSESKSETVINNPAIDLSEEPAFFTINDDENNGVISFKNSFPYSQIQ